jgi:hypothetical protein
MDDVFLSHHKLTSIMVYRSLSLLRAVICGRDVIFIKFISLRLSQQCQTVRTPFILLHKPIEVQL